MNKILLILYLVLTGYINCTYWECEDETDPTKCSNHEIEIEGFSCYKYSNIPMNKKGCQPFPDNTKNQISSLNLTNGMNKEMASGFVDYDKEGFSHMRILILDKVVSKKDEEIQRLNKVNEENINAIKKVEFSLTPQKNEEINAHVVITAERIYDPSEENICIYGSKNPNCDTLS